MADIDSTNAERLLLCYYGTGQVREDKWRRGCNLALLENYAHVKGWGVLDQRGYIVQRVLNSQKVHAFRGVGAPWRQTFLKESDLGEAGNTGMQKLARYVDSTTLLPKPQYFFPPNWWEQAVAHELLKRIQQGWSQTQNIGIKEIILLGVSRGGFQAQMTAHLLNTYGQAKNLRDVHRIIRALHQGEEIPQTAEPVKVKALFALEPVATHGWGGLLSLVNIKPPKEYCGFTLSEFPSNVERGCVILTAGEDRKFMHPNVYRPIGDMALVLQQLWFQGIHADTMGPSTLALRILAYLYVQMKAAGVSFDEEELAQHVRDLYQGAQKEKVPYSFPMVGQIALAPARKIRKLDPVHEQLHWSYTMERDPKGKFRCRPCWAGMKEWKDGENHEMEIRAEWAV